MKFLKKSLAILALIMPSLALATHTPVCDQFQNFLQTINAEWAQYLTYKSQYQTQLQVLYNSLYSANVQNVRAQIQQDIQFLTQSLATEEDGTRRAELAAQINDYQAQLSDPNYIIQQAHFATNYQIQQQTLPIETRLDATKTAIQNHARALGTCAAVAAEAA